MFFGLDGGHAVGVAGGVAAVYGEGDAGDEGGVVGGQEEGGSGDL